RRTGSRRVSMPTEYTPVMGKWGSETVQVRRSSYMRDSNSPLPVPIARMLVVMVEHYADRLRQFPGGHNGPVRRLRFRHSTAVSVAAVLVIIGGVSISTWAVWLLPLLLVPLAVAVWGW